MDLFILRHAKSSWSDLTLDDFDRPLKGRGKRDAIKMGQFIKNTNLIPDRIISSTATRAVQTVKRALSQIDPDLKDSVIWSKRLYLASPETWLHSLRKAPLDATRIMIVGHNPGLEELIEMLCPPPLPCPADGKLIPTATLAHLTTNVSWPDLKPGVCQLERLTRPRWLPDLSPDSSQEPRS